MKDKFHILIFFYISILIIFKSSQVTSQVTNNSELAANQNVCKKYELQTIKTGLTSDLGNTDNFENVYEYISSCQLGANEVDNIINIYTSHNQKQKRVDILSALKKNSRLLQNNEQLSSFYISVAYSEDRDLSSLAIQGLVGINKIDEVINIYNSAKSDKYRKVILEVLNDSMQKDKRILKLYQSVANSENPYLAASAFKKLTNYSGNDKRWTTWKWPKEVIEIMQKAVEKDFYKISLLDYYQMLALVNRYPNSRFTKSCIEYRKFTEGTYFGKGIDSGWGSDNKSVFRQPFLPDREIKFWPKFIHKYPNHPGSDDVMYRLARAYEMKGNYKSAILWYYKSSQELDGSFSDTARDRILFIVDILMSSESLTDFLKSYPKHPLHPYILYSKIVHLMREGNMSIAQAEIKNFIKNYKNKIKITPKSDDKDFKNPFSVESGFWNNVQKQLQEWQQITKFDALKPTDESIYKKAAFWYHNDSITENYLWLNLSGGYFNSEEQYYYDNIPDEWEGATSSIRRSITYKLVEEANRGFELKNHYLHSISLFKKLLKNYPNSKMAMKAQYSIGLNYYYLYYNHYYPDALISEDSWQDLTIKTFKDFMNKYSQSSMADDALLTIADMEYTKSDAVQTLKKLLRDYPNGDRYKEAQKMLSKLSDY